MPSTPPSSNSLFNLLNPYSSMASSSVPRRTAAAAEPESPSTLLLRELAGDEPIDKPGPSRRISSGEPDDDEDEDEDVEGERDRMSPTPTPTSRITHVISSSASASSEDEDAPPRSIMFGSPEPGPSNGMRRSTSSRTTQATVNGNNMASRVSNDRERTPRSPPKELPTSTRYTSNGSSILHRATSPGPFRAPGPPSSSTSGDHSRSTSPGPSTIAYVSGMEGLDGTIASTDQSSREPSLSPKITRATFREPPVSSVSGPSSTSKVGHASGYLDPVFADGSSASAPKKGKAKAGTKGKNKSGKRYTAVSYDDEQPNEEEEDEGEEDQLLKDRRGRMMGLGAAGGKTKGIKKAMKKSGLDEYEKALWQWVNVEDLDGFLEEVYAYYKGKGIYCIALARVLNLLTTFFVVAFSTFLLQCIDYSALPHFTSQDSIGHLDEVLIPQCLTHGSFPHMLFIVVVTIFYVFQLISFALSLPRLWDMYRFYTYLLGIPDADIQTLPWPEIVRLIGEIRKHNPVTSLSNGQATALADMVGEMAVGDAKKLDAHDVANRILRQENYLIALFNKDLLDLRVRLPIPHSMVQLVPIRLLSSPPSPSLPSNTAEQPDRQYISFGANTLTKALEWNLRFCLMGFLFDGRGQVRKEFVRERKRKDLVEGLRTRFIFMGVLNAIFAPFIIIYLLIYSFFRYFEEYHKNPSSIGSRQYTPYAQWKFREFNELPHLFERRLDRSYPVAKEYIDQFPNEKSALVMRFVAFVAGSFAAVLLVASLLDPDLFLHFEITPHRTVLFYLGIFGSILAIARGMVPEENLVFDPELSLREVVRWTHYLPGEWKGKLHSKMVHAEFSNLFALKITIFFTELLSVLLTPFILWFSLPPCAGAIIDFFREFTVHVDGVGYVCSFAVFDFRRHGNLKAPEPGAPLSPTAALSPQNAALDSKPSINASPAVQSGGPGRGMANRAAGVRGVSRDRGKEWRANENKMEKSFLHFKATHPDWQPSDPSSSIFLDRLVGMHQHHQASLGGYGGMDPYSRGAVRSPLLAGSAFSPPPYPSGAYPGTAYRANGMGVGAAAQSRALGLALGDEGLRERSKSYDRAWAKSSQIMKSRLETMKEKPEKTAEYGQVEVERDGEESGGPDGWSRRVVDDAEQDEDDDEEGFLKDVGMMGLLQQVMGR